MQFITSDSDLAQEFEIFELYNTNQWSAAKNRNCF
jgi:hypothetical protein